MERLTKAEAYKEGTLYHFPTCFERCGGEGCKEETCDFITSVCDKLGYYEDLEEQGLLLKLPCKVGDKAYHIINDDIADPSIYISEYEIKDVSAKAVYFADDWWSLEEMQEMNAYLNKAEAEKALAEMEK